MRSKRVETRSERERGEVGWMIEGRRYGNVSERKRECAAKSEIMLRREMDLLRRRKAGGREWKDGGRNGEENRCESGVRKDKVRYR